MVNIGIDFDGVIIDSSHLKIQIAKENFGLELTPETAFKDNILRSGVSQDDYNRLFRGILASEKRYSVERIPWSKEMINKLYRHNGVYIITSRHNEDIPFIKDILKHDEINYHELINTSDQSKNNACLENKIRIYLDDDVTKLEQINNDYTKCFLLDKPYNKDVKFDGKRIERVDNWRDFYAKIKYLL
jgi:uncharacterized protein